jgi:hypothetical protein
LVDTRVIYCGDNLDQLAKLPDRCIDLVYIDPPFNSNRNYEVFWGETKEKRSFEDRHGSTQAYIEFMRPRCSELVRVLKPTGSFYYHCDWHASHYVKVMLDQVFGEGNFQNEIVWKRSGAHNDPKRFGANHDTLFFYTGSNRWTWNKQYTSYSQNYLDENYRYRDPDGRRFRVSDMTANKPGGDVSYEWTAPDVLGRYRGCHFRKRGALGLSDTEAVGVTGANHPSEQQPRGHRTRRLLRLRHRPGRRRDLTTSMDRDRHFPDRLSGYGETAPRYLRATRGREALARGPRVCRARSPVERGKAPEDSAF